MKIDNRTKWSTDDLRAIIAACLKSRGVPSTGLEVEVVSSKQRISGRAVIGRWRVGFVWKKEPPKVLVYGEWMLLRLPNPSKASAKRKGYTESPVAAQRTLADGFWTEQDARRRMTFACVVDHEVAHLQGLRHEEMSDDLHHCTQPTPWLGELQLREESAEVVDVAAARSDRAEHARAMLAKAETRLKRAETIAKRWRRRVAGYERNGG